MAGNKSRQMNLPLLLPLAGLIVELIVFVILRSYNVTISPSMLFFFALIGLPSGLSDRAADHPVGQSKYGRQ